MDSSRRRFLSGSTLVGAGLLLDACKPSGVAPDKSSSEKPTAAQPGPSSSGKVDDAKKTDEEEVTATEDLMREHGILRRALIVYRETAPKLRAAPGSVRLDALQKTAKLFRAFGEDYHERKLEEAFIFPGVKAAGGATASYVDTLVAQHQRGREITDYVLAVTSAAKLGANAQALALALEAFARMYDSHTAIEDTVIFPAWKKTLSPKALDEMGDKFEDIEHAQLGEHGFEDAVEQIATIEKMLGLADLAQFTAPAPPKAT